MYPLTATLTRPPTLGVYQESDFLTGDQIEILHQHAGYLSPGTVYESPLCYDDDTRSDSWVSRQSDVCFLRPDPEYQDLYHTVCHIAKKIMQVNQHNFQFDLTDIEALQYTRYTTGQYYARHVDTMPHMLPGNRQRKLSFSVQLSQAHEYQGGDVLIYMGNECVSLNKQLGSAGFFASYLTHEVTPVTSGTRMSLVGWLVGPKFR